MWRSWKNFGSNALGDWGCHLLDVLIGAYDELISPIAVQTHCQPASHPHFHPNPCQATLTYAVSTEKFVHPYFSIHCSDTGRTVSRAAIGLPPGKFPDGNMTVVICEGGSLVLSADGRLEIWRDGKMTAGTKMPELPDFPPLHQPR